MAKNPFKKKSLMDTLVNVGIGGAANVVYDQVLGSVLEDSLSSMEDPGLVNNIIKIVGGAVVGGMISNQYARAAADGIAVVGVSNLVNDLMSSDSSKKDGSGDNSGDNSGEKTTGLPSGTVGRIVLGNRRYKRRGTNGLGNIYGAD